MAGRIGGDEVAGNDALEPFSIRMPSALKAI